MFSQLQQYKYLVCKKKLILRFYIAAKTVSTTKQIKLINKKIFAKTLLDKNVKVFLIYITFLFIIAIYLARKA